MKIVQKKLYRNLNVTQFSQADLLALVRGEILAIRIKEFCPLRTCAALSANILGHPDRKIYPHAPEISRVMDALYESYQNPKKRAEYQDSANWSIQEFRKLSGEYLNPLDHLRILLQDTWAAGAERQRLNGRPLGYGLAQVFDQGAYALPHQDFLRMDEPYDLEAQSLVTQLTALIYVKPAEKGGRLQLWREHFGHDEFMKRKNPKSYGLSYDHIPPPALSLMPEPGELIIADSTKVHAVTKVIKGHRIAVNCFIGFKGVNTPLTFWT